MRRLKTAATIILLLFWCTAAYSQEEPEAAKERARFSPGEGNCRQRR